MQSDAKQIGITGKAEKLIKRMARRMVGKAGLTKSDIEDLEQELRCELLQRLRGFDPSRSTYTTFIWFVVERHVRQILENRTAQRRDPAREAFSLNEDVSDVEEGTVERWQLMSRDEDKRLGSCDEQNRVDVAIDVNALLARLPKKTRKMCELLKTLPIPEAARRLGWVEITLRKRLEALRGKFRDAGLADYLGNPL